MHEMARFCGRARRARRERKTDKIMKRQSSSRVGFVCLLLSALWVEPLPALAVYIGNSLTPPSCVQEDPTCYGSDGATPGPLVILGEYSPAGPLASSTVTLPVGKTGTIQDVQFYGGPSPGNGYTGNYDFTLYVLSCVTTEPNAAEQTFQVLASEHFCGTASTAGIQKLTVSGMSLSAGDFLAFAGVGPWYPQSPNDALNSDATYEDLSNPDSSDATPPGLPGAEFVVATDPEDDPDANYEYIDDNFGNQGRTYGIGVDVAVGSTTPNTGIYVWDDCWLNGTDCMGNPIDQNTITANQNALINACTDSPHPISLVLLNAYDSIADEGKLYCSKNLQCFNAAAHAAGLRVYALFTDSNPIPQVVTFNDSCTSCDQRFDGIAMDFEGPWPHQPQGATMSDYAGPTTTADIQYYADAKATCVSLPLHVSIGWWWGINVAGTDPPVPAPPITYLGPGPDYNVSKPAYQLIFDIVDSVDVQAYSDDATTISGDLLAEANYAAQVFKPVWDTVLTSSDSTDTTDTSDTFYLDGEGYMWGQLANVTFGNFPFQEFILEDYLGAYSSGAPGWPVYPPPASISFQFPGQSFTEGTGITGFPALATVGTPVTVTAYAVDDNNQDTTINDSVTLGSVPGGASFAQGGTSLPGNSLLLSGPSATFQVTFSTAGSWTITGTDPNINSGAPSSSASLTVVEGQQNVSPMGRSVTATLSPANAQGGVTATLSAATGETITATAYTTSASPPAGFSFLGSGAIVDLSVSPQTSPSDSDTLTASFFIPSSPPLDQSPVLYFYPPDGSSPEEVEASDGTTPVTGTPDPNGNGYDFTVMLSDAPPSDPTISELTGTAFFALVPVSCPAITLNPFYGGALPAATAGVAYPTQTITATGGSGAYTYSVSQLSPAGALGLTLTTGPAGVSIAGTAAAPGTVTFTVTASDNTAPAGCPGASANYTLTVNCPGMSLAASPSLPNGALLPGVVSTPYPSTTIAASGGSGAYNYSVSQISPTGSLGLTLSSGVSGVSISGAPSASGTLTFTVSAADAALNGCMASSDYSIQVNPTVAPGTPFAISTVSYWNGTTNPPADTANQYTPPYQPYSEISQLGAAAQNGGNTPTVGETFIAPANAATLSYFTFYLLGQAGTTITLQGEVFNWFGSLIAGGSNPGPEGGSAQPQGTYPGGGVPAGYANGQPFAPLYSSEPIVYTASGGWDALTVQIPGNGVTLAEGGAYVIDLTAIGGNGNAILGNTWLYLFGGLGAPTQGGGNFSNPDDANTGAGVGPEYGAWNEPGFGFYGDLAFTAGFNESQPSSSTIVTAGKTAGISLAPQAGQPGQAGVTGTLMNNNGSQSGKAITVTALSYTSDPESGTTSQFGSGSTFLDLNLSPAPLAKDDDSLTAVFYYPTGMSPTALLYWDSSTSLWKPVKSDGPYGQGNPPAASGPYEVPANPQLTDGGSAGGGFQVILDDKSAPAITALTGTAFALSVPPETPVLTWAAPANIVYDAALGPKQLAAKANTAGAFVYTPPAGTILLAGLGQTLSVTFTPKNTIEYTSATATTTINVEPATPVITWAKPAAIVYGTALSGVQLDATANVLGQYAYNPPGGTVLNAGNGQKLSVTFTPTDNIDYMTVSDHVTINVSKAMPMISWATPAPIVYGTPLSAAQLDATANVPGTFTYSPPSGKVLPAGNGETLSVTFTPTDSTDYTTAKATVSINVGQATPLITWANPAEIVSGTALGPKQLDAKANIKGTFVYTPPAGTVLPAGSGQVLSVNFTPADATDYTAASATVSITVEGGSVAAVRRQPNNPPPTRSMTIGHAGGNVILELKGEPTVGYVVQCAPSPAGPWTDLSDPLTAGETGLVTYGIAVGPTAQFYRTRTASGLDISRH